MKLLDNRHKRAAQGLCPYCGGHIDTGGKMCSACRAKNRNKLKKRRTAGVCVRCCVASKPVVAGSVHCAECKQLNAVYMKSRRAMSTRAHQKVCRACGRSTVDGQGEHCRMIDDLSCALAQRDAALAELRGYQAAMASMPDSSAAAPLNPRGSGRTAR